MGVAIKPHRVGPTTPDRRTELETLVKSFHRGAVRIDDTDFDKAIGIRREDVESALSYTDLLEEFGGHRFDLGDMPYTYHRAVYRRIPRNRHEPIVDLGSGYGRFAFYGALLEGAHVYGIEIVPKRFQEAIRVRDRLGLSTVEFSCGDACVVEWPVTASFCLMNSFLSDSLRLVLARLRRRAQTREIFLASASTSNLVIEREPWLKELGECTEGRLGVRLFVSDRSNVA